MLKLGTVFSGIGAIEHALERMNIPYKIEFACDNGDVDILSKHISDNVQSIESEFNELLDLLKQDTTNQDWLPNSYYNLKERFNKTKKKLVITAEEKESIDKVFKTYEKSGLMNVNQNKTYKKIKEDLQTEKNKNEIAYNYMKLYVKLDADIKKMTGKNLKDTEFYVSGGGKSISRYKSVIKEVKSIRDELSMLHEKINTEVIRSKVFSLKNEALQKEYVDSLYQGKENQNKVKQTYFANYDIDETRFHWNVSFFDGTHYKDKIDLLVGGSPCQSFSLVGKQRGLSDTRGTLFYEFARIVSEVQPKVFIYENVKAVLSNDNGNTWETMKKVFDELGYSWFQSTLNARDYGIPQNRERIFVVGFKNKLNITDFKFPEKKVLTKKMQDFLIDNASGKYYLPKKGVEFVTSDKNLEKRYTQIDGEVQLCQKKNQQFNWHGDFVFEEDRPDREVMIQDLEKYFLSEKVKKYVLSTGTKGFYSKPEIDLEIARPLLTTMHKMHRAGVDNYVTTEGRLRKLTPRECLRLMGFCDSFKIVVSDTAIYQQSGNSIVVDVLINILQEILNVYPNLLKGVENE